MSLYPENPEVGEAFNNRQWSGTADGGNGQAGGQASFGGGGGGYDNGSAGGNGGDAQITIRVYG